MAAVTSCFLSLLLFIQKLKRGESFTLPRREAQCQVTVMGDLGLILLERSVVQSDTCEMNELSCWKGFALQRRQAGTLQLGKSTMGDMTKMYKIKNSRERVSRDFPVPLPKHKQA